MAIGLLAGLDLNDPRNGGGVYNSLGASFGSSLNSPAAMTVAAVQGGIAASLGQTESLAAQVPVESRAAGLAESVRLAVLAPLPLPQGARWETPREWFKRVFSRRPPQGG